MAFQAAVGFIFILSYGKQNKNLHVLWHSTLSMILSDF